jgi:hypothetical protein
MTIKFFIRDKDKQKSPIRAVVSFFGVQYPFAVGITVKTAFWNQKKCRCKNDREYADAAYINQRIDEWENILKNTAKEFELKLLTPTQADFKSAVERALLVRQGYINGDKSPYFLDFANQYKNNCSNSSETKQNYGATINHISEYEKKVKSRLKFSDITIEFYNSFKNYLLEKTYKKSGAEQHYAKNTIGSIIKNLLVFFNEARRAKYHDLWVEGFKKDSEDVDNIYLTTNELIILHNLKITENLLLEKLNIQFTNKNELSEKISSLINNKDRFLIGAFTSMRYGDYSGIENIKSTDKFIAKRTKKTGARVVIPMHWIIREILERRNNVLPNQVSNLKLNEELKELGKLAGINSDVERTITRGGRQITTAYKKYELMSTHTARRSGCTNMYLAGIDIYTIMGFSGHTSEKSFRNYIKIKQEENARRFVNHPFFKK